MITNYCNIFLQWLLIMLLPTIIFNVLGLPEVDKAWWVPEAILFGHESVIHLDQVDAKLCCFIVNLLQGSQHLWTLFVFLVD